MKSAKTSFEVGELYLFHADDKLCPADGSLWAVVDKCIGQQIFLESSTADLKTYRRWHLLPKEYRFCRLATRAELRDYMYNLCWFENQSR